MVSNLGVLLAAKRAVLKAARWVVWRAEWKVVKLVDDSAD
jgi:hypothetical protein